MNKVQNVAAAIGAQIGALDQTQANKVGAYVANAQAEYTNKKELHAEAKADFDAAEAVFQSSYESALNATKSSMEAIVAHLADNVDGNITDSVGEVDRFLADRETAIGGDFGDFKIDESAKTAALIAEIGDAGAAALAFNAAGITV